MITEALVFSDVIAFPQKKKKEKKKPNYQFWNILEVFYSVTSTDTASNSSVSYELLLRGTRWVVL